MPELSYAITRDDEDIDVTLDYEITDLVPAQTYGPPEDCYPAEGGEITSLAVTRMDTGEAVILTPGEADKVEAFIVENHEFDDGYDYDPGDW